MAKMKLGANTFVKRASVLAAERGMTLIEFICAVIEEQGSLTAAAYKLQVNRNTLRHHLNRAGIELSTRYVSSLERVK